MSVTGPVSVHRQSSALIAGGSDRPHTSLRYDHPARLGNWGISGIWQSPGAPISQGRRLSRVQTVAVASRFSMTPTSCIWTVPIFVASASSPPPVSPGWGFWVANSPPFRRVSARPPRFSCVTSRSWFLASAWSGSRLFRRNLAYRRTAGVHAAPWRTTVLNVNFVVRPATLPGPAHQAGRLGGHDHAARTVEVRVPGHSIVEAQFGDRHRRGRSIM